LAKTVAGNSNENQNILNTSPSKMNAEPSGKCYELINDALPIPTSDDGLVKKPNQAMNGDKAGILVKQ
jgi:hypothetical protein